MMKQILLLLFPIITLGQAPGAFYNITVNTPDAYSGNLFYQRGGTPQKPVIIIDSTGNEIFLENWGSKGWDFKVNYNNKLSYFDRFSKGWFIMDSLYNVVDSVYCQNGYTADNHDFIALPNGNYILFAYDQQPYAMDTVVAGGDPNALVEGLIIQELDSNHNVLFEWRSWDHFHVTDNTYYAPWTGSSFNFIHANAIDIDFDGHLLISSRNLDEITKIHRTTGEIIWRWGGSQNEFTFINDYPFTHQHTIRSLGGNRYILYDNGNFSSQYLGGGPPLSRAVEYVLDTNLMTAEKVWEFVHPDSLYTPSIGSVQRLPNGNTLINFGNLQAFNMGTVITEVDSNNQIVFQLEYGNGGNLYRAHKFDWFFACSNSSTSSVIACDSYTWDGVVYTISGEYTNIYTNVAGCDSTHVLDLTINNSTFSNDTLESNIAILWNGMNLQSTGDYSVVLTNTLGCDSVANIHFILTPTSVMDYFDVPNSQNIINIFDVLGRFRKKSSHNMYFEYNKGIIEKRIIIE